LCLRGVADSRVLSKRGGQYHGFFADCGSTDGVAIGQLRHLKNGWLFAVQALLYVEDASQGPFNIIVLGFCMSEEHHGPLVVSLTSIMEKWKESERKMGEAPSISSEKAESMAAACNELLSGVIADANCGYCLDPQTSWSGFQNFMHFSASRKLGRRPVATEESSGRVGRPTAKVAKVVKEKPKAEVTKEKMKAKVAQENPPVLQKNSTMIPITTSEVPTPASKRLRTDPPQFAGSHLEVENAVLKERAAASVSIWNTSVEAATSAEGLKRLEEGRAREDAIRNKADLALAAASAQNFTAIQESNKAALAIAQDGFQAQLAAVQAANEASRIRETAERTRETAERNEDKRALAAVNKGALSAVERSTTKAYEFSLALHTGAASSMQGPAQTKEVAFKDLLSAVDCEEHFDLLWNEGAKSRYGLKNLSEERLLDLGLTATEVSFLKDAALNS